MNWVHKQWDHNGRNQPENIDAISILEEVKEGKNFRCVEYGIVATACLNAVRIKSKNARPQNKRRGDKSIWCRACFIRSILE